MKHLSLKVIFICVFLPPILYIFSIQGLEVWLQKSWKSDLRANLITNPEAVLKGKKSLYQEIHENIDKFLKSRPTVSLGVESQILVQTQSQKQIYPRKWEQNDLFFSTKEPFPRIEQFETQSKLAKQNFEILKQDLVIKPKVHIPRNSWLAYIVLIFYIVIFSTILIYSYRFNVRQAENILNRQHQKLLNYQDLLEDAQQRLQDTCDREKDYQDQIQDLRKELRDTDNKLQSTEESALAEIEKMEEKLRENISARQEKEAEIENLKQVISNLEQGTKTQSNKKEKQHHQILKRFNTLYRNVDFHERAIEGFLQLTQDLQLKAEERIHYLNQYYDQVKVKRKIFSKKGNVTALETEFAYKGRIYWKVESDHRPQVLNIGTKNTQKKDLAYLEKLSN